MSKVIIEITSKGLHVPNTILTQWGWREGTEVIVEQPHDHNISIRPRRLTAEAISDIAGTYLFEKVGDAVAAEEPVWDGEKWRIKVALPSLQKELGKLTFTADGQLVAAESDSPALGKEVQLDSMTFYKAWTSRGRSGLVITQRQAIARTQYATQAFGRKLKQIKI